MGGGRYLPCLGQRGLSLCYQLCLLVTGMYSSRAEDSWFWLLFYYCRCSEVSSPTLAFIRWLYRVTFNMPRQRSRSRRGEGQIFCAGHTNPSHSSSSDNLISREIEEVVDLSPTCSRGHIVARATMESITE